MEIQFHSFKKDINYPVAENMASNLSTINAMADKILELYPNKENINLWCRGSSGAIIAAIISSKLIEKKYHVTICHVKKEGEKNHHGDGIYFIPDGINIVVDDFICSGDTINFISEQIQKREQNFDCLIITLCIPLYSLIRIPQTIVGYSLKVSKDVFIEKILENQIVQYDPFPNIKNSTQITS